MTLPIIGITMGDPTGIGPEVIVKALSAQESFKACRPIVFGDREVLLKTVGFLGLPVTVEAVKEIPEDGYLPQRIFVLPVTQLEAASLRFGHPDTKCGEAMVKYVEEAVQRVRTGRLDAITTCPINKRAINSAGCLFSGHTELLAHLVQSPFVAMMFVGSKLKVVLVTIHLPLKEVPARIDVNRVLATIRIADQGLKRLFGIGHPKIAVLGLNPHSGEEGLLGEEEKMAIIPAIEQARSQGIEVEGPFPADSFFSLEHPAPFDVVVSMYHDQGLIPIKMVDFEEAVNLTLGLPFIRTSVGHGTAYDIAGKGLASPANLLKALLLASKLSKLKMNYQRA